MRVKGRTDAYTFSDGGGEVEGERTNTRIYIFSESEGEMTNTCIYTHSKFGGERLESK